MSSGLLPWKHTCQGFTSRSVTQRSFCTKGRCRTQLNFSVGVAVPPGWPSSATSSTVYVKSNSGYKCVGK